MCINYRVSNIQFFRYLTLFFLIVIFSDFLLSQELQETFPDKLKNGLENGDADEISNFFQESLSFELLNQSGVFSKIQAERLLHEFFQKNKVDSFTIQRN
ncbi:MAG: DUF4783 domain-containing protein, partial [bacterium]|nr:DUF4783 domain-containing protein [bacterium]